MTVSVEEQIVAWRALAVDIIDQAIRVSQFRSRAHARRLISHLLFAVRRFAAFERLSPVSQELSVWSELGQRHQEVANRLLLEARRVAPIVCEPSCAVFNEGIPLDERLRPLLDHAVELAKLEGLDPETISRRN